MSTERQKGKVFFVCDICDSKQKCEPDDFKDKWSSMRDNGWRAFKNRDEEWEHRCPDCVGRDR